ncbi:antibiotic biosynthesis monooxygenase [Actinomadura kijaniata]|uniref:antibiotic biosynthesis monooxygenase n=1 Tax=Actinomadura kijaniata TaxID=46161 RepID=UPI000829785C|nr:antibiotic biosynthesis monooxygenase [Actinomadura kijaniata]
MAVTVELTRFRTVPGRTGDMLAARPAMVADFRADRAGFLGARLVRLADDEWLDIVEWRSAEDFAASRAKGANRPGIAAFFATIAELTGDEQGVRVDGGEEGR